MKKWDEILEVGSEFVIFLENGNFFNVPYKNRDDLDCKIVTDEKVAINYATNQSDEKMQEWEKMTNMSNIFPDDFEWSDSIEFKLEKNKYFNLSSKNFNGVDERWTVDGVNILFELFQRDIYTIFSCYANGYFPPIWQKILNVYLDGGVACGWDGQEKNGRLVVFSNE